MQTFHFKFHPSEKYRNIRVSDINAMSAHIFEEYTRLNFGHNDTLEAVVIAADEDRARQILCDHEQSDQYLDKDLWNCFPVEPQSEIVVMISRFESY